VVERLARDDVDRKRFLKVAASASARARRPPGWRRSPLPVAVRRRHQALKRLHRLLVGHSGASKL
jgi:hypothetical protein